MNTRTKLIHTKGTPDKETMSIVPPVHFSTVFGMHEPSSDKGFQYGRVHNPTRQILEDTLADLEGAKNAAVFTSGSAAIFTLFTTLKSGDHIICHKGVYEGTRRIIENIISNFGIECTFIDLQNTRQLQRVIKKNTKLAFCESITNPFLQVLDIKIISEICHKHTILLAVDNTLATPIIKKPLCEGADMVIESLTKGINGHSDVLGGLFATNNTQLFAQIKSTQITIGNPLSPFDCFLVLRGIKTLPFRIRQQENNAKTVMKFLKRNKAVSKVFFPGFGTLVSVLLKDTIKTNSFLKNLKLITIGHSFGGAETLVQQPAVMMDVSDQADSISKNFLRFSIGLEDCNDIVQDLNQALKSGS